MLSSLRRKSKSLMYTDIENAVRDATNSEPYNVPSSRLFDIALYTHHHHKDYEKMLTLIIRRMSDYNYPRHVWKSLILIHYLILHGSNRFINDINRDARRYISRLRSYHFYREGVDLTHDIRREANKILNLLADKETLQQERMKAAKVAKELYGPGGVGSVSSLDDHYYGPTYRDNYDGITNNTTNYTGQTQSSISKDGNHHGGNQNGKGGSDGWFVENDEWTMNEQTSTTSAFFNEPDPFAEMVGSGTGSGTGDDDQSIAAPPSSSISTSISTSTPPVRVSSAGGHTTTTMSTTTSRPTSSHTITHHQSTPMNPSTSTSTSTSTLTSTSNNRISARGRVQSASISHHPTSPGLPTHHHGQPRLSHPTNPHHGATPAAQSHAGAGAGNGGSGSGKTPDPFGGFDPFSSTPSQTTNGNTNDPFANAFSSPNPQSQQQQQQYQHHHQQPRQSIDHFSILSSHTQTQSPPLQHQYQHQHQHQQQSYPYQPSHVTSPTYPSYTPSINGSTTSYHSMTTITPSTALAAPLAPAGVIPTPNGGGGAMVAYSGHPTPSPFDEQPLEYNQAYVSYQQQQQFTIQYQQHQQQQQAVITQTNLDYFDTVEPMKVRQSIYFNNKDTYDPVRHDVKVNSIQEQKKTSIDDLDIGI